MIAVHFENDEGTYGFETQEELDRYLNISCKKVEFQDDDGITRRGEYWEDFGIYLPFRSNMKKESKHPLDKPKEWKDFDIIAAPLVSLNMMAYYDVKEKQCIFQSSLDKEKYGIKKVEVVEEDGKFIINIYHNIKALAIELR